MSNNKVKHLFNQIESIKSAMSMKNGNKPELWIQRQNLQDLYHQIILNDIDFTIDKKLEQDLWNLVFKSQINYFQAQIKENSSSLAATNSSPSSSSLTSSANSLAIKQNKNVSSQKKYEAQASLFFFLEAARGFYTKLLEDIILAYDSKERISSKDKSSLYLLPFCQRFSSIFDRINDYTQNTDISEPENKNSSSIDLDASLGKTTKSAKDKQILYICQHILTHLGDIARYANLFQQAKNYYLHAIILVPYLGHPYNQLGILFETSRTNQLSTVFYYFRSIAVRYKFPLATTNLENFLLKLVDIPLTRYNPTNIDFKGSIQNDNYLIKLAHKDLITLFLQISAFIYFINTKKNKNNENQISKVNNYLDLFRYSFDAFIRTPLQRDKLDSYQLCQMMSISIYLLTENEKSSLKLFSYLVEILVLFYNDNLKDSSFDELILPSIYLASNYLNSCDEAKIVLNNQLWLQATKKDQNSKFVYSTVNILNSLNSKIASYKQQDPLINLNKDYNDYPLNEDRLLDSFLPFEKFHTVLNISKYLRKSQLLADSNELFIRKKRIVSSFSEIISQDTNKKCFLTSSQSNEFKVAETNLPTDMLQNSVNSTNEINQTKETIEIKQPINQDHPKKRRQNVAIHSITQKNMFQKQEANPSIPIFNNNQSQTQFRNEPQIASNNNFRMNQQQNSMTFNPPTINKTNYDINHFNMQQQQQPPKYVQNIQKSQQNFFPSALNRKFTLNQNSSNNFDMVNTNDNFLSNSFKNRNNTSIQENFKQNKNFDYFNPNNNTNNNSQNQIGNNFIQNSKIGNINNFQSDQFNRPQLNFNSHEELNTVHNQQRQFQPHFFNSNSDDFNRLNEQQSKSNVWPTNLPFNLPIDETNKNENLFQNKNNPIWNQFHNEHQQKQQQHPQQKLNKLDNDFDSYFQFNNLIQNPKHNENALISNLLFQLNSESNNESNLNSISNNNNSNESQQKSIWTFPSNFNS